MTSRGPLTAALLGAAAGAACAPDDAPAPYPPVRAATFNVHGSDVIRDPVTGPLIAGEIAVLAPDFAALQECVGCEDLLANLPHGYDLVSAADSALAILYDSVRWTVRAHGAFPLGSNDDGWGRREVRWAELRNHQGPSPTGPLTVYTTHWCVTIRNPDDACDVDRHLEYARILLGHISTRIGPVILGGDLNVFDGFEDGPVISLLREHGLVDTLREITDEPVITYQGNSSFPPGRIDYVFATAPVTVTDAAVATESVSDHRLVSADLIFDP